VQPAVLSGLQKLAARGLSYDLLVHTRHLRYVRTVAESCPEVSLVIDHLAKPPISKHGFKEWAKEIEPLAAYPNMYCKLSGLVTEANWNSWRADDLRPYVDHVLELFGPERLIFGSDHPVCLLAASYARVLKSFNEILAGLNDHDRNRVFAENARTFYRLN
jgi:L-fuconolactonase